MIGRVVSITGSGDAVSLRVMIASTGTTLAVFVAVLAVLGLAMIVLAVWLVRTTRTDPRALGPLEVMGHRRWRRADADRRRTNLDTARPPGASSPSPIVELDAADESAVASEGAEPVVVESSVGESAESESAVDQSSEAESVAGPPTPVASEDAVQSPDASVGESAESESAADQPSEAGPVAGPPTPVAPEDVQSADASVEDASEAAQTEVGVETPDLERDRAE